MSLRRCSAAAFSASFRRAASSCLTLIWSPVGVGSILRRIVPEGVISYIITFAQPAGGVSPTWVMPLSSLHL